MVKQKRVVIKHKATGSQILKELNHLFEKNKKNGLDGWIPGTPRSVPFRK